MVQLRVKAGREYVFGGKVYFGGDLVDGVPEKFARILTSPKGPLEAGDGPMVPVNKTDLPRMEIKAMEAPVEPEAPLPASQYLRRDMQAGPIGEATPSPSSRRGRPRKNPISDSSGDDAA